VYDERARANHPATDTAQGSASAAAGPCARICVALSVVGNILCRAFDKIPVGGPRIRVAGRSESFTGAVAAGADEPRGKANRA